MWKEYLENDFKNQLALIQKATDALSTDRVLSLHRVNSFALWLIWN
jgi:hypothetical protein